MLYDSERKTETADSSLPPLALTEYYARRFAFLVFNEGLKVEKQPKIQLALSCLMMEADSYISSASNLIKQVENCLKRYEIPLATAWLDEFGLDAEGYFRAGYKLFLKARCDQWLEKVDPFFSFGFLKKGG